MLIPSPNPERLLGEIVDPPSQEHDKGPSQKQAVEHPTDPRDEDSLNDLPSSDMTCSRNDKDVQADYSYSRE